MIVIFVEFIDQLIDYLINRASLTDHTVHKPQADLGLHCTYMSEDMFLHGVAHLYSTISTFSRN